MQVRGRKQKDKWTGSKHVSHILRKAPERRDIWVYFRDAMWSYGVRIGRLLGCVQPLHHSAIPQIYLPAKRKRVKLLKKDFTAVVEVTYATWNLFSSKRGGTAAHPAGCNTMPENSIALDSCAWILKVRRGTTRVFILLYGANQPYEHEHKLRQTLSRWHLAGRLGRTARARTRIL